MAADPRYYEKPKRVLTHVGLERASTGFNYWENSCYIDTLLMCIFSTPSMRVQITDVNVDTIPYNPVDFSSCRLLGKTIPEYVKSVQKAIQDDFKSFLSGDSKVQCRPFRNEAVRCVQTMREFVKYRGTAKEAWVTFSVTEFYSWLCILFPGLKMNIPILLQNRDGLQVATANIDLLDTGDYYLLPTIEAGQKRLDLLHADKTPPEFLVFSNASSVKRPDIGGEEEITLHSDVAPFEVVYRDVVMKSRPITEEIIPSDDGKFYTLTSAIILKGVVDDPDPRKRKMGAHYVACMRSNGGTGIWMYYDDLQSGGLFNLPPEFNIMSIFAEPETRVQMLIYSLVGESYSPPPPPLSPYMSNAEFDAFVELFMDGSVDPEGLGTTLVLSPQQKAILLEIAVMNKQSNAVNILVSSGVLPLDIGKLMSIAIENDDVKTATILSNIAWDAVSSSNLSRAIEKQNPYMIALLITKIPVDTEQLIQAANTGNVDVIRAIIGRDKDVRDTVAIILEDIGNAKLARVIQRF